MQGCFCEACTKKCIIGEIKKWQAKRKRRHVQTAKVTTAPTLAPTSCHAMEGASGATQDEVVKQEVA